MSHTYKGFKTHRTCMHKCIYVCLCMCVYIKCACCFMPLKIYDSVSSVWITFPKFNIARYVFWSTLPCISSVPIWSSSCLGLCFPRVSFPSFLISRFISARCITSSRKTLFFAFISSSRVVDLFFSTRTRFSKTSKSRISQISFSSLIIEVFKGDFPAELRWLVTLMYARSQFSRKDAIMQCPSS